MHIFRQGTFWGSPASRGRTYTLCVRVALVLVLAGLGGCSALTNPVADSLPVRMLDPDLRGVSREGLETIPLRLLGQAPPDVYRLEAGDVLGVYLEGVLGQRDQPLPVHYPVRYTTGETYRGPTESPPAIGYPIPIREDGTLSLPLVEPVRVAGMTVAEAEQAVREAYTVKKRILRAGQDRIIVTLVRPREYRVKVFRQDVTTGATSVSVGLFTAGGGLVESASRRGQGFDVVLPAYENDVLTALSRTGGLPGTEAINEVVIERASRKRGRGRAAGARGERVRPGCPWPGDDGDDGLVVRIPIRFPPGERPSFRPQDVLLDNGDIVFIESRPAEVFYTGGLLPSGEWLLPRDFDLNVVEAISRVHGILVSGQTTANNLNGQVGQIGFGFPNPSLLVVVRRTRDGGQARIRVDLNRALRDPSENLLVQPGDMLILQESPGEAFGRYVSQVVKFNFLAHIINTEDVQLTGTAIVP